MRTTTRRLITVLVGAPLALGLLAGTACAEVKGTAGSAAVLTQDPIGPPTGVDPFLSLLGPSVPESTAPTAAGPATALPRTGDQTTVLLGIAGVLLVIAGVLMHVAARPMPGLRYVVRLA